MKINFYGYSDDNFAYEIEGGDTDEVGCYKSPGVFLVRDPIKNEALYVVGYYAPNGVTGCWSVGICPHDEDVDLPDWTINYTTDAYSAMLTLDVPDCVDIKPMYRRDPDPWN